MKAQLHLIGSLLYMLAGAAAFAQGSLTPPGAPAPTMKTLAQIEPRTPLQSLGGTVFAQYVISQPGSYYLTGNIVGVAGKSAIEIDVSSVTIDLNGFALIGVPASVDGIIAVNAIQNVTVRNGTVQSWGGDAVDLHSASSVLVSDLRVSSSGGKAIWVGNGSTLRHCACEFNISGIVTGEDSRVADCTARSQIGIGITTEGECVVQNCLSVFNSDKGIQTGADCTVTGSSSLQNGNNGITMGNNCSVLDCRAIGNSGVGISPGSGAVVRGCAANSNSSYGIYLSGGSSVLDCTAQFNTQIGIYLASGCTVNRCTVTSNNQGISSVANEGIGCTITHCTATANTSVGISATAGCHISDCTVRNNGVGISIGADCEIQSCSVVGNSSHGISVSGAGGTGARISGCTVSANQGLAGIYNNDPNGGWLITGCSIELNSNNGILVTRNCRVIENHFRANNSDALTASGNGNHIEGNTMDDNTGYAVRVSSGANNVVLRNRAHGNLAPQFSFAANSTSYGPLVDLASGDISGTINANHPAANFRY